MTNLEKVEYLYSKGWINWWHHSRWIHPQYMQGANWDSCTVDTESAFQIQEKENLKIK